MTNVLFFANSPNYPEGGLKLQGKEEAPRKERECMYCKTSSQERPLIAVLFQDEEQWVCAGCLPYLIHGPH